MNSSIPGGSIGVGTKILGSLFFGFFLAMGLLFVGLTSRESIAGIRTWGWAKTSCVITRSEVRAGQQHGRGSGNYYFVVGYQYDYGGRNYASERYELKPVAFRNYGRAAQLVEQYRPESAIVCYVNPAAPDEAVLKRGDLFMPLFVLFPLIFVVIGFVGIYSQWRPAIARNQRLQPISAGRWVVLRRSEAVPKPDPRTAHDPLALKPAVSPWGKLVAALIFGLFWNGLVSMFVVNIVRNWRSWPIEWFLALFMVPFVLIGLGTIAAAGYFFLALFNPRPRLTITPRAVPLGGTFRVEWEIRGRTDALRRLRLRLEGREEATYQSGKNTATDKNVFANIEIADLTVPQAMRSGGANVTVPGQLMHSFTTRHNRIVWSIQVQGEIAHWPDIKEEFPVTVLPAATVHGWTPTDANQQPLGSTA